MVCQSQGEPHKLSCAYLPNVRDGGSTENQVCPPLDPTEQGTEAQKG